MSSPFSLPQYRNTATRVDSLGTDKGQDELGYRLQASLPCLRLEVPAIVISAALEFLRPLQRKTEVLERQTIVLIIAAIGNVDRGHQSVI